MKRIVLSLVLSVFSISILGTGLSGTAYSLSNSEFQAGRIIDDAIFYDHDSMPATEIQNFLNEKVQTCDTFGEQPYLDTTRADYGAERGYPPPYTCLKEYSQVTPYKAADQYCDEYLGGLQTSSEIISNVALACGINPQVLIVMLQREQNLITDDWPWSIQYDYAMGVACPDTAACDPQYKGFFNQVYFAARLFSFYTANPNYFNFKANQENFIPYSPRTECGGGSVFIENQATVNLYIFSPYQPNDSALQYPENLNSDGCSFYGNLRFWLIFNEWFGSSLINPTPTFTDISERINQLNETSLGNWNNVLLEKLEKAERYYDDGNIDKAEKELSQIIDGLERLVNTDKINVETKDIIVEDIGLLLASWQG